MSLICITGIAGSGKSAHEFEHLLKLNAEVPEKYTSLGAHIIDATQPVADVVEAILAATRKQPARHRTVDAIVLSFIALQKSPGLGAGDFS
jgi:thymidylate kinase